MVFNSSTGFTLNGISDFSSNYNELEAQGTGTVSATGTLLDISAGNHTTTADSLDGGVTLHQEQKYKTVSGLDLLINVVLQHRSR